MPQTDLIRFDLPATHKYLNVLGTAIVAMLNKVEAMPEPEITAYNVQLAVHEICTNIVDHAYNDCETGRIEVALAVSYQPFGLTVDLRDTGRPFDAAKVAAPDLKRGQVRGYGLFLTKTLMDEVTYRRGIENDNQWQLVMKFD